MPSFSSPEEKIATSSVEEGLDFACSLISDAISKEGRAKQEKALQLLEELSSYVQLRYVGELGLALEYLAGLGHQCSSTGFKAPQFWSQLKWVAQKMELSATDMEELAFPKDA